MTFIPGYSKLGYDESDNFGVDWVLQYQFNCTGICTATPIAPCSSCSTHPHTDILTDVDDAVDEFRSLIHELEEAGLRTQVRHGPGNSSLLVFIRVPRNRLENMMYNSR